MYLLRLLIPSWRFFDRSPEERPVIEFQSGDDPASLDNWELSALARRNFFNIFINHRENLLLYTQSRLELILANDILSNSMEQLELENLAELQWLVSGSQKKFYRFRLVLRSIQKDEILYCSRIINVEGFT